MLISIQRRNNYSKCIKCKTEYKNKIETKCDKCNSKANIKQKGDMNNELMELRFIDTYRFMDSSLDTLVKKLLGIKNEMYCSKCQSRKEISNHQLLPIDENDKIKLIAKCKNCHYQLSDYVDYSKFETIQKIFNKQDWDLVLQKGVYPYEWADSYKKHVCKLLTRFQILVLKIKWKGNKYICLLKRYINILNLKSLKIKKSIIIIYI